MSASAHADPYIPGLSCQPAVEAELRRVFGDHHDIPEIAHYLVDLAQGLSDTEAANRLDRALRLGPLSHEIPKRKRRWVRTMVIKETRPCRVAQMAQPATQYGFAGPAPASAYAQPYLPDLPCQEPVEEHLREAFGDHHDIPGIARYLVDRVRGVSDFIAARRLDKDLNHGRLRHEIPASHRRWVRTMVIKETRPCRVAQMAQPHGS